MWHVKYKHQDSLPTLYVLHFTQAWLQCRVIHFCLLSSNDFQFGSHRIQKNMSELVINLFIEMLSISKPLDKFTNTANKLQLSSQLTSHYFQFPLPDSGNLSCNVVHPGGTLHSRAGGCHGNVRYPLQDMIRSAGGMTPVFNLKDRVGEDKHGERDGRPTQLHVLQK